MQNEIIEAVLVYIDKNITENINIDLIAEKSGYSAYHFSRVFSETIGISLKAYVTWRKLRYALSDISQGEKILDVAVKYGFETHGGFAKAFKKCFGFSPSLYSLHVNISPPEKATVYNVKSKLKHGGRMNMQIEIKEIKPFSVVGYTSRHRLPNVNKISNIPVFWEKINLEYEAVLSTLHHTYTKSYHCEIAVCFDIDEEHNCFTYMLGVGVDEEDYDIPQRPGTYIHQMQGGLYAKFTTPLADEEQYTQSIHDTWKQILNHWLPESKYEYDDKRVDFEYYDERDHSWLHDGKSRMDIFIPIRQR